MINRGVAVEIANDIAVGEEVTIPSVNGELRGSLFVAEQEQSQAVIMVMGSGATSYRKSWVKNATGFWKPLTEMLHESGFTVLLLEKRGVNGSVGHWEHQSFEDRTQDVKDAIEYLKTLENVDEKSNRYNRI